LKKAALLIEDKDTALIVRTALECGGYQCESHASMVPLLRAVRRDDHAAIVVDASDPGVDCGALLAWRRNWLGAEVAVIALGPDDAVCAARNLDLGVDDFVAKPVRGAEFLARLGAALRRQRPIERRQGPSVGGCRIDRAASAIVSPSTRVALTARELALAQLLFENAGQVVTRARLARDVWGQDAELSARSIEQHIYQLRRKLKRCAGEALALRGVYGSGYRIEVTGALQGLAARGVVSDAPSPSRPPRRGDDGIDALVFARRASDVARQAIAQAAA